MKAGGSIHGKDTDAEFKDFIKTSFLQLTQKLDDLTVTLGTTMKWMDTIEQTLNIKLAFLTMTMILKNMEQAQLLIPPPQ